jgi:hypothetical protein
MATKFRSGVLHGQEVTDLFNYANANNFSMPIVRVIDRSNIFIVPVGILDDYNIGRSVNNCNDFIDTFCSINILDIKYVLKLVKLYRLKTVQQLVQFLNSCYLDSAAQKFNQKFKGFKSMCFKFAIPIISIGTRFLLPRPFT